MREVVQSILFSGIIGGALVSLIYPWRFRTGSARIWVHLPLALIFMFGAYEMLMSPEMNIRIDLLILLPLVAVVAIAYLVKLYLLVKNAPRT